MQNNDATTLQEAIRSLGEFSHVNVLNARGHLVIQNGDEPVARASFVGPNMWGLSFLNHAGKWEGMPFVGSLPALASDVVSALGPFLEKL